MILQAYVIFDSVAEIYHPPQFLQNDGVAQRNFLTLQKDENTQIGANPLDFAMYHIGEYNDQTGEFTSVVATKINTLKEAINA